MTFYHLAEDKKTSDILNRIVLLFVLWTLILISCLVSITQHVFIAKVMYNWTEREEMPPSPSF